MTRKKKGETEKKEKNVYKHLTLKNAVLPRLRARFFHSFFPFSQNSSSSQILRLHYATGRGCGM